MSTENFKKPLYQKLGIEADHYAAVVNPPDNYFELLQGNIEQQKVLEGLHKGRFDVIHYFVEDKEKINFSIMEAMFSITPWGMIWISWPKKSSTNKNGYSEDLIRKAALKLGLVDVKVCYVDEKWSALKLVYRKK